ncbi:MAG: YraN family protein [Atopobiaceae bacterium]|jgi:putative endonuclease|nr:YraN family protein [Atopobiaceae bacterium]MCH4276841.1 YraN family protein [Atopobiaceae bacterium]
MSSNESTKQQATGNQEEQATTPVAEMTPTEVESEGEKLTRLYLQRRGYVVGDDGFACEEGSVPVVASDDSEGEVVLVDVRTHVRLGEESYMPELAVDVEGQESYRRLAMRYLFAHPECKKARVDVISIAIVGERCARLRHLIGAYSWEE